MNDYITLAYLGTFAGMIVVINILVQFLKPLIDKITKFPTRYVVWVISIILSITVQALTGIFTAETIVLLLLNSIVLTLAAMGSYEAAVVKIVDKLKK